MNSQGYKIKQYLELFPVYMVRPFTITQIFLCTIFAFLVLNFLNDLGITQSLYSIKNIFFMVSGGIISVFGILILANTKKFLKLYILLSGISSLYLSTFFLIVYYEFMYSLLKEKAIIYLLFAIIGFISIIMLNYYFLSKSIKRGDYRKGAVNNKGICFGGIVFSGAPYLFGKGLAGVVEGEAYIFAFVILVFAYVWGMGIHFIYKYYLIKKYEDYVDKCILPHV